ncbi:hypothetical protein M0802_015680 [Mischocyttarus mexicanus]|nr:hypothetical protein M0802_015680 [Mischocyttarus mexicanus]
MRPFSFTFKSSNHQTAELKRRTTKPLSPLTSDSSEEEIPMNRRKAPSSSLDIRMDSDRILMKAMEDISIIEENRKRCGNLKGAISGAMKRHLASAAEAIKMARDKRKVRVEDSADSTIAGLRFELQQMEARQKILERKNQLLEKEVEKLRKEDFLKKKRGQEEAAPRCRITEEVRIPKEMAVNRRIEKVPMPPSNIETKVEGLVASVATLAKAITQLQKRMDSALKPRDDGVELAAVPPPPPSFSTLTGARNGMSFTKVLSKREKRKERAEAKKQSEVVTGSRVTGQMPTKKRRVGPAATNNSSANTIRGNSSREEAVVSVTCAEGGSYRDALLKAREKIDIKDLGVDSFKIRRGVTGSFIFKLKGAECKGKASKFAEALKKALPEAKVALPKRTGEFVLCGLDAGVTRDEIVKSMKGLVVGLESCDVRVGDIYPGKGRLGQRLRSLQGGLHGTFEIIMEDTEKELTPGGIRNPPTAMRDGALAGHPSSTSGDCHSSAVGNLAAKMETETGSEKYGAGTSGAAEEEVLFLGRKASTGKDMRPFSFTFQSSGKNHQTAELKRRTTKPLSPLTSDSSEEEIPINRRKAPSSSLDIRMDPDRILMKAMEDISIVEENRRRSGNLKGAISGSMKRHLASAAEAIKITRDKRKARVENSADSTIAGLRFELQQMEARQKILERKNQLLEKEVEKLRKEDSLKKKRGQEEAAPRCRITEEVRIPKEMAVNRRIEKMPMPPSNIETKVEGLVASVATLAKAITQIQKKIDSVLKPRDDGVELAAVPPPPRSFSTGARDGMSFTKVLSKREKRKERAEAKKKIEVVTGSRVTGKMPTKKRRVGPATSMNNNNVNNIRGNGSREEAVVSVTCAEGGSYRDALLKAREK